ncbi:biotin--[acetyl-CoA-carboxylase] ligase [Flavobacterium sp. 7A]|uniref:biotin--[acetyl-CoA-carboxylase] ligase n=1 Tax=Flavobacterium sp. 7A TaxID=2940571 RepID=UPI002226AD72|nr:biotin--[acetyl-CoA-carboxylase] ligase [Flavobacterium sp. 7A]MCW2119816.1 BirA family biotin operon repressor/biotin-[acetyl-CoA-carboxylase] ligase [Flavobacterium sp. 7A]
MKLIKLNAIDSTNVFLKELAVKEDLDNYTVVTAQIQTNGKGQMGAVWHTEAGKNLIMSVFVKKSVRDVESIFNLNVAVAVSIVQALETFGIPNLNIKWPNDIMSCNFKIGGILIENNLKVNNTINSVIGLGLNVNQIDFGEMPKASSLKLISKIDFDRDAILIAIVSYLEINIALVQNDSKVIWEKYLDLLFKKGIPMAFKNTKTNQNFMGIIQTVSTHGHLEVLLEDDSLQYFELKEIQMLY